MRMVEAILSTRLQGTTERAVEEQAMLYEKGCDWFLTSHMRKDQQLIHLGFLQSPPPGTAVQVVSSAKKKEKK